MGKYVIILFGKRTEVFKLEEVINFVKEHKEFAFQMLINYYFNDLLVGCMYPLQIVEYIMNEERKINQGEKKCLQN